MLAFTLMSGIGLAMACAIKVKQTIISIGTYAEYYR